MKRFPKTIPNLGRHASVLDESRILVAFKRATKIDEVEALARELGLKVQTGENLGQNTPWVQINHTDRMYWLRSADNSPINDEEFARIEKGLGDKIHWIGPVYVGIGEVGNNNYFCPFPNVLLIRKRLSDADAVKSVVAEFHLTTNEPKSKYLTDHDYYELPDPRKRNAYEIRQKLEALAGDVMFENMPMVRDWCAIPNDTFFVQQWDMTQIQGPQAWDISSGSNAIVVAVIDSGVDLTHPDLVLAGTGIDLGDMVSDGSPNNFGALTGHGTCCAGIVAGTFNNAEGVAGVAGSCRILPLAISTFSDVEIASGLNWSIAQGASVISMSFSIGTSVLVDTALANASAAGLVMCAATGNGNGNIVAYPARNANVIACGASDQVDNRKTPLSPDGEAWGADFGAEISVVAPGVFIPSTDIQGNGGFNNNAGGPITVVGVNHPSSGDAAGNYFLWFNGTSSATPHVAGLAALIRSQYPALTNTQVRNVIERTAQKTGAIAYAETAGHPNGTWNQEMGYGRINALQALDNADVMIKDWAGDNGIEPSTPPSGNFWDFSDIVTRITDDGVFNPSNPSQSKSVERGQTNYIYVQVTNNGPRDARNVAVNIRITPYVGLQFVYPNDWTAVDAMHITPASIVNNFVSVPAGTSIISKFSISAAQVEDLYGWENSNPWHPCLLAQVTSDNDYAYATSVLSFGNIVVRKNNFAQRNLTVIDVLSFLQASIAFPFVVGNKFSKAKTITLNIDKVRVPENARVVLDFNDNGKAFPAVDFTPTQTQDVEEKDGIVFQDRTKLLTKIGCCDVLLTLERNSKLEVLCLQRAKLDVRNIRGGELIVEDGKHLVRLTGKKAIIEFDGQENTIYGLSIHIEFPRDVKKGDEYVLTASQTNERSEAIGGASVIYRMK